MPEMSFQPPAFAEHFSQTPPDVLYHYTDQPGLLGLSKRKNYGRQKFNT
jgi:hypothetical protein